MGRRLTANAARHETRSMKPPPITGPAKDASEVQPVHEPIARAWAVPSK